MIQPYSWVQQIFNYCLLYSCYSSAGGGQIYKYDKKVPRKKLTMNKQDSIGEQPWGLCRQEKAQGGLSSVVLSPAKGKASDQPSVGMFSTHKNSCKV